MGRCQEGRIAIKTLADHQVRLLVQVAQVVVEAARPGIRPVDESRVQPAQRSASIDSLRMAANRCLSQQRLFSGTSTVSSVAPRSTAIAW